LTKAVICGVDEAGRGPLAGPVYAAAVVLGDHHGIVGLADSKKLSARRRESLALQIKAHAAGWSVASATVEEIDRLNILQATLLAMKRAVEGLALAPSEILVDGLFVPKVGSPARAIVRGDGSVAEISAASILAKTARDAVMLELHEQFPRYGFDRHKGYPTAAHLAALHAHGVSIVHRRSFGPVRALIATAGIA
jgi:ribonuclease HII